MQQEQYLQNILNSDQNIHIAQIARNLDVRPDILNHDFPDLYRQIVEATRVHRQTQCRNILMIIMADTNLMLSPDKAIAHDLGMDRATLRANFRSCSASCSASGTSLKD